MDTEIEVKFAKINLEEIRSILKKLGANQKSKMRLMKRVVIDNDLLKEKDAFIRIRDQGDKITLTYKQFSELSLTGAKEIELEIEDFDKAVQLFQQSGLDYRSFQESKRESWELDGVSIELDEWPWLKPYIEIEGPSEKEVKEVASSLGFEWKDAIFGDVMAAYRAEYPHLTEKDTVGNIKEVRFEDPLPELFKT